MKKKLLLAGVAALSVVTLASCGGKTATRPEVVPPTPGTSASVPEITSFDTTSRLSGKTMNMYINYKAKSGVTYTGNEAKLGATYQNPIDGKTYTKGDLMPMW